MQPDQGPQWPQCLSDPGVAERIRTAKVLCVGAGGIGCELLKTLALTGFESIELVDLDTIDTSNLNRQFLFRKRHVGQSKARVAAEAVRGFRPRASIAAHQGNIRDPQFGLAYFRGFDIVLNGLDNVEARRHVNRLCLAAKVPLIESGTTGHLGQVTVHLRVRDEQGGVVAATECYECRAKPVPKAYPVCTIRNTPDKPVHCIVWAKDLLFPRLFGRPEAQNDLDEEPQGEEGPGEPHEAGPSAAPEEAAARAEAESAFLRREGEGAAPYARRIFDRAFRADIDNVLKMEKLWRNRAPPTPLSLDTLAPASPAAAPLENGDHRPGGSSAGVGGASGAADPAEGVCKGLGLGDAHRVWSVAESTQVFLAALQRFLEARPQDVGSAAFDKDDALAVEFVAAAANLRAAAYGIPPQSLFATKGIAGNIIHAIATTNAVVGGLIVVEALKVLCGAPRACKVTSVMEHVSGRRLLTAFEPSEPVPACAVCGTSQLQLRIDTAATSLARLIAKVLKKELAMLEPSIECGGFLYEEGEGMEPDEVARCQALLPKAMADLPGGGLGPGVVATVFDNAQDFKAQIVINHQIQALLQEEWDEEQFPEHFSLTGTAPSAAPVAAAEGAGPSGSVAAPAAAGEEEGEGEDVCLVEEAEPVAAEQAAALAAQEAAEQGAAGAKGKGVAGGKRKRGPAEEGPGRASRPRVAPVEDTDMVDLT